MNRHLNKNLKKNNLKFTLTHSRRKFVKRYEFNMAASIKMRL